MGPVTPCYLLLATCHLLLATCYLPLATCYLLLATCYLLLATCYLPLATCYLLLATCYLLLATCYSQAHPMRASHTSHVISMLGAARSMSISSNLGSEVSSGNSCCMPGWRKWQAGVLFPPSGVASALSAVVGRGRSPGATWDPNPSPNPNPNLNPNPDRNPNPNRGRSPGATCVTQLHALRH